MTTTDIDVSNAAEALLAVLAARGVDYIFGNAGTDFPPLIEALAKASLGGARAPKPVTVPHENLGIAMAHGCYLATGRPQALMLHVNVGTANAICGLFNAARENIPIFLAAGRTPINEDDALGARSVFIHWGQEMFDQAGMLREVVKWEYELRDPRQVEAVVDRGLSLAMSEPRGPVYLTLPREVLAGGAGRFSFRASSRRQPAAAPAPDAAAVAQAARWLAEAERPLIVTASFGREADAVPLLSRLAERHALPVVGYRPRYVFLPSDHSMHLGYEPGPLLPDADVILVLDCDVPWIPKLHKVNPAAKVIHVGADPLFSRYPMRTFPCDLAITAASRLALAALDDALATVARPDRVAARRERIMAQCAKQQEARAAAVARMAGSPRLNPARLADALNRVKRPDDIIVSESSLPVGFMGFTQPGTYFGTSPAGGLGWGLGAALGLKLGAPARRVIAVVGDGSYMFGNPTPAHYVAAAYDLPVLTVIMNNRMWGAVRRATLAMYPDGAAAKVNRAPLTYLEPTPDYERIVEASGGYGEKVASADELPAALERALHVVEHEGRQAVLNVLTEYSDSEALSDARR
ncbi:MAG TPA: thiamine pyrophosphate-requiring protein [Alphaproteobacteria bacterium]